jgi:predicted PurR-regulated permease PerM
MKFYNKRSRDYNYFKIFLAVFAAIACSIFVYFMFSKISYITAFFSKLFKILSPVIIGLIFAGLLNPIVSKIENYFNKKEKIKNKKKLSRILGIVITYVVLLVLFVILIRFFIPNVLDSINLMVQNIPKYLENIFNFIKTVCEKYNISSSFVDTYRSDINNIIKNSVVPNIDIIINNLATGITNVIKLITNTIISIIISIYLIYDKEVFLGGIDRVLKAYCSKKVYDEIVDISKYIYKVFGGFLVAKLIDSLIIGVLTFIVLSIFNIPYALIISLIVGVTNIIPYFGPFIGAIPSIVLLLMISPTKAIEFGVIILVIQQFDGNILGPKLIGNKIGIKSFWVLFAILLFGGLWGLAGMILAVPLFACIYELSKNLLQKKEEKNNKKQELEKLNNQKKKLVV